jgi:hypothetical protein
MDFGDFLKSIESDVPVQEQTKQDLLDVIRAKATIDLGVLAISDLAFPDGREGRIHVANYKDRGLHNDGLTLGDITLVEPIEDGYEAIRNITYTIFRTPDSLGLSKYVINRPRFKTSTKEEKQKLLEDINNMNDEEARLYAENQEMDRAAIRQFRKDEKEKADEQGESLVFEPEATMILSLVREAEPDDNLLIE